MNNLFKAIVPAILSLILFLAGVLAHPVFLFMAFVPLLGYLMPAQKSFTKLAETLPGILPAFFVFVFLGLYLMASLDVSTISIVLFIVGNTVVAWLSSLAWRIGKATSGYFGFLSFWIAFEYILITYLPGLSLPSVGAQMTKASAWTGWYPETGVLGGSLWVLLVNLLLFVGFRRDNDWALSTPRIFYIILAIAFLTVPIAISYLYFSDSGILLLTEPGKFSNWVLIPDIYEQKPSKFFQAGEFIGLICFWMGLFLAISVFVRDKTRIKKSGRSK
jgi:apolipoprotein N-acyltransferase